MEGIEDALYPRQRQNCTSKQKCKSLVALSNLQETRLAVHFYGDDLILIQHLLNPVKINTVGTHKRNTLFTLG